MSVDYSQLIGQLWEICIKLNKYNLEIHYRIVAWALAVKMLSDAGYFTDAYMCQSASIR